METRSRCNVFPNQNGCWNHIKTVNVEMKSDTLSSGKFEIEFAIHETISEPRARGIVPIINEKEGKGERTTFPVELKSWF
mgnify:CR=1 FL=1